MNIKFHDIAPAILFYMLFDVNYKMSKLKVNSIPNIARRRERFAEYAWYYANEFAKVTDDLETMIEGNFE